MTTQRSASIVAKCICVRSAVSLRPPQSMPFAVIVAPLLYSMKPSYKRHLENMHFAITRVGWFKFLAPDPTTRNRDPTRPANFTGFLTRLAVTYYFYYYHYQFIIIVIVIFYYIIWFD